MKFSFLLFLACAFTAPVYGATAREIIALIDAHVGSPAAADTVDTFKAGDPDQPVTGIAVTMMATYDVLEQAAKAGDNLIITHEPTFYNHLDTTATLIAQNDRVLADKQAFIRDHHLVVWRFHDGWHRHQPDGILTGMERALGWLPYQSSTDNRLLTIPQTTLGDLASTIQSKLNIRVMRVVGDRTMSVTKVGFIPGAAGSARQIALLERPDVEALLIGETPEWETVEYVADAASQGKKKGLIIFGHIPSEQAGMEECATWLRIFLPNTPVQFIPAKEPFWTPTTH